MGETGFIGALLDDRYRVIERLGAGGMATVFLARQESLDRDVVVKVPDRILLEEEGFRARFQLEIRSMVRLRHPHIVTVLEAGEVDGVPYAVMEFLEGGSLKDRFRDTWSAGRFESPRDCLSWLVPIASALDFVHSQNVVHRDVKPANLLFDAAGNPFISDFGIAKALGTIDTNITRTGTTPGTPIYMAPEAGLSLSVTGASDQYALAVVVYQALCGKVPFEGDTPMAIMLKKMSESPQDLAEVKPGLPPGSTAAVMRALSTEPGDRFPTCQDFAKEFEAGIHHAAGELGVAVTQTIVPTVQPVSEETITVVPAAPAPSDTPKKRKAWLGILLLLGLLGVAAWKFLPSGDQPEGPPPRENPETPEDPGAENVKDGPIRIPEAFAGKLDFLLPDPPIVYVNRSEYTVAGRLLDAVRGSVRVNGRSVLPDDAGRFEVPVSLVAGENRIEIVPVDEQGHAGEVRRFAVIFDDTPPEIEVREPADGQTTREASIRIEGTCRDTSPVTLRIGPAEVLLDVRGAFSVTHPLPEDGPSEIRLEAVDAAGNRSELSRRVIRDRTAPGLTIISPTDGLLTRESEVIVRGRVEGATGTIVTVAGASVTPDEGGSFESRVSLAADGPREIVVEVRDRAGNTARQTVSVTRDTRPPGLKLGEIPGTVEGDVVTVGGLVYEDDCRVTVNGRPVEMKGRFFRCELPLVEGDNAVSIVVTDAAGNSATQRVSVRRSVDFAAGRAYQAGTLEAFRRLIAGADWRPANPVRNTQGLIEAVHEKTGLTFVLIPAGEFAMGSPPAEVGRYENEGPLHRVEVGAFLLSTTECTQEAWKRVKSTDPSNFKGDRQPVETVSYSDVSSWLREAAGGLRLPSEAEWEYACRAETRTRYSFGDDAGKLAEHAWYRESSGETTHPVGKRLPNLFGLYDMHGNVWEWCEDLWHRDYRGAPSDGSAWTSAGNSLRVYRGGGYGDPATNCRSASRVGSQPKNRWKDIGFRPAAGLEGGR